MKAVLVTGTRDPIDPQVVWAALTATAPTFVILGDCPTGVDAAAKLWCQQHRVEHRVHIADWDRFGRSAGPRRNGEMVKQGADIGAVVLAFPRGKARGTRNCMAQACAAGLSVEEL